MNITIRKPDLIALAAGIGAAVFAYLVVFPYLPVICFFIGLMVFGLTQKAQQQKAALSGAGRGPKTGRLP